MIVMMVVAAVVMMEMVVVVVLVVVVVSDSGDIGIDDDTCPLKTANFPQVSYHCAVTNSGHNQLQQCLFETSLAGECEFSQTRVKQKLHNKPCHWQSFFPAPKPILRAEIGPTKSCLHR